MYLKGVARTRLATGYRVPVGDSARWTLSFQREGQNEASATRTGRLGDFGSYTDSIDLPASARVGWYRVTLDVRDRYGWREAAEADLGVAEYRVPEFAVRATADTSVPVYAGDSATIRVEAHYLFGPPMSNATVTASVFTSDKWSATPRLPALAGFQVGRWTWLDGEGAATRDDQPAPARLGADGAVTMRVPSRRLTRPGMLTVSVSVQDANRQSIAATTSVPLRVADAFVGIRTTQDRWDWVAGTPIPLKLVVVRGNGTVRSGARIGIEAHRIDWRGGDWKRDTTWRDSITSADRSVRTSFVPKAPGWYEVIATVRDEQGRITNVVCTST